MPEYQTTLEIENIPFVIEYFYHAGEPATIENPGSKDEVELKRILFAGDELSKKQEELFISKYSETAFNDFLLDDLTEQNRNGDEHNADKFYEEWISDTLRIAKLMGER